MKSNSSKNVLGSTTTPWAAPRFLCYAILAIFIPVGGFVLGGAAVAKCCGTRKAQGLVLLITANVSVFAYGALFTTIIARA